MLRNSSPVYVYRQVADHIGGRIESGDLPPGTRLLPERDLAVAYGVSVFTVRRAMADLRRRGLVETVPVKGTFVMQR
ncbi:winged helix-turn-helix domain-containing protein [Amycolatopsis sp. GM8]|uniref:winged helix-turn-helix domain-containing protein n=1 Tax=Amycolatopsis sp. GM8 TaxID=2896530 RepID=UPI001F3A183B|nr:winged helix-turn-helix domain-containing protein [Amycolatopsis sp. GM8]